VGIVVFGREAYTLCPLTLDYNVLQSMVSRLQLGQLNGEGTAIGNAVGTAINRLRSSEARSRVIILVTDGESNTGNISPDQAAQFAETIGIRIYTILIGTSDETSVSIGRDIFGLPVNQPGQYYPINPELLQRMASRTGGEYARATSREELMHQVQRIDQLERSMIQDLTVRFAERFHVPLLLGLLLLGIDLGLRATRMRRFP
jgi:Ca-activated chloride channel family protein